MELVMQIFSWIMLHWQDVLSAVVVLLSGLIAVFLLVPGPHPEDWLQKIVDVLKGFSRKPKE